MGPYRIETIEDAKKFVENFVGHFSYHRKNCRIDVYDIDDGYRVRIWNLETEKRKRIDYNFDELVKFVWKDRKYINQEFDELLFYVENPVYIELTGGKKWRFLGRYP